MSILNRRVGFIDYRAFLKKAEEVMDDLSLNEKHCAVYSITDDKWRHEVLVYPEFENFSLDSFIDNKTGSPRYLYIYKTKTGHTIFGSGETREAAHKDAHRHALAVIEKSKP